MTKPHTIDIEVLGDIKNGYRLKVGVSDLGMYMWGWTARRSTKNSTGWWIQPNAIKVGDKWRSVIEFNKSKDLWQQIENTCIEMISNYEQNPVEEITDEDLTDEAIEKNFDNSLKEIQKDGSDNASSWHKV